jgi:uncharacterized membrane protein (DUF4010 family)
MGRSPPTTRRISRPTLLSTGPSGLSMPRTVTYLEVSSYPHALVTELIVLPGCYRDPSWPWYRQPFPWWTMFFLVPLYSACSSLSNLQSFRSSRLPIMIIFSCCSYTANKVSNWFLSDKGALAPAAGALVIGLLGNMYSRWSRGTAFTSMVTGVLFLVPVCCL